MEMRRDVDGLGAGDGEAVAACIPAEILIRYPIPKSAGDSSGVPHTRQITAEQSPQMRGSVTSRPQVGQ
jgi:hypothetical protein